ncbi:HisA/HisF-related TIM barrel protein [Methylophilus sp. UBA6697]|uniref:HisA/HisF-related TIM barrel protein n=1 Tax=Methylophilus sp. UBA6697 TaxID=1946902 RepID=UPI0025E1EE31|nr:HisA/HisF-related TIM barrel protein [Methylophilus sp. UBA6697]
MHIIPVIDLMHGQVVQAIQGQRQHYRAIQSQLTDSHALLDVITAILQVYAFDCVYIADLNAITGQGDIPNHLPLIKQVMTAFPNLQWWVDAGLNSTEALKPWLDAGIRPIIASETLIDIKTYQAMREITAHSILSLDFFEDGFHGPDRLLTETGLWSQPTILMSLPKVGANQGPEVEKISSLKNQHPQQAIYAAGGVRHVADIQALAQAGADGVLIASALHQKQLTASDLALFAQ